MKKNPLEIPPRDRRSLRRATLAAIGLTAIVLYWSTRAPTPDSGAAAGREHSQDSRSTPRKPLADAEARRLEKLAKLGETAVPTASLDSESLPVPARVPERELMSSGWHTDPEPAVANFTRWTTAYLAKDADKEALLAEGEALAIARRAFLKEQISQDPRRVLADTVPLALRDQLPPTVLAQLESRVGGYGDLYALNTMPSPDGTGSPTVDHVSLNGEDYQAYRYGNRTSTPYVKGASLHGVSLDGELAVLDSPVRTLESGEKLTDKIVNEYCPVSQETIATPSSAETAGNGKTTFQVGTDLFGTCEPAHVANVESALLSGEKNAENTQKLLTNHDLQALYIKSSREAAEGQVMAAGDSGATGSNGYIGKPPTSLTLGAKKVLIMRVQPTDKPMPATATVAYFDDIVTRADGWNARMKMTSYNKASLTADITPTLNLPQASSYYVVGGTSYQWTRWMDDAKAAATAAGYNMNDYACYVVAHAGYSGLAPAWGGGGNIWCNGSYDVTIFAHEYGHVFWLPHANSWTCTDGNPISPSRVHEEYGDINDYMGYCYSQNLYGSYNPYFKNLCNWLPDAAVQNITKSGTYRVYQDDGATSLTRTLALKVGRDYEFNYWLSVRGDATGQTNFLNGVSIRATSAWKASDSKLLDLNDPSGDRTNAPLAVNQTWYDSAADITFKTIAVGGTNPNHYADVQITFGPKNTGGYRPLVSGGVYRLKNRQNGEYLDVPGNSSAEAVSVQAAAASGTASQNWVAWRNTDGSYGFNHQGTTHYLDVSGNSGANGADVIQYTGSGADSQKWWAVQNTDGYLFLVHKGTDAKVLDMATTGANDISQWGHGDSFNQQWYPELVAIVPGTYRMLPRHAQAQTLDVPGSSGTDGTQLNLWPYAGSANQKWEVSNPTGSWLRLTPTHAVAKALDVNGGFSTNGTKIQQWTSNNGAAQHWGISRTDGNWLRFTPECASGSAMVGSTQVANGTLIQLWQFTGANDQQWRFADAE